MSVHDLARAASADLRAHTVADVEAGLDARFVAHTRRRRTTRVAIASAAAVAVLVGGSAVTGLGRQPSRLEPTGPTTSSTPVPQATGVCHDALVRCLGDRTYVFGLSTPVTWQIPQGYGVNSGVGATSHMVESYSSSGPDGVTVMEGVKAASQTSRLAAGVPDTAEGFVRWLAGRPYLVASPVRRVTVGGRDAWHVRVTLRPHVAPGPGRCSGTPGAQSCYPVTWQAGAITGIWSDMNADYTAFDSPTAGTVVVWSWAFGHVPGDLHRNQRAVDGLSWGGS